MPSSYANHNKQPLTS
jgi:hypothetical protein